MRNVVMEKPRAWAQNSRDEVRYEGGDGTRTGSLSGPGGKPGQAQSAILRAGRIRRLMPIECERLMGFPDNWTKVHWKRRALDKCPDGHRYKAVGNSMAVPVMQYLGVLIAQALGHPVPPEEGLWPVCLPLLDR